MRIPSRHYLLRYFIFSSRARRRQMYTSSVWSRLEVYTRTQRRHEEVALLGALTRCSSSSSRSSARGLVYSTNNGPRCQWGSLTRRRTGISIYCHASPRVLVKLDARSMRGLKPGMPFQCKPAVSRPMPHQGMQPAVAT